MCGKTNRYHCSITKDDTLAVCTYVQSKKKARDGRWIHVLRDVSTTPTSAFLLQKSESEATGLREVVEVADAERRDAVYRYMLDICLGLTPEHGHALLEHRGLGDTTIAAHLFASAPTSGCVREVCDELANRYSLLGVPGFFHEGGRWRLNINAHNSPGILIPICDVSGLIAAIQVRRDAEVGPRYVWLSSACKPQGVTSSSPIHFAKPDLARRTGRAIITEGALKSIISAEKLDACFVGVPGVDSFPSDFGIRLRRDLPELFEVVIAYDADWRTKANRAITRLYSSLRNAGLRVRMWDWDIRLGKGFDDYLLSRCSR